MDATILEKKTKSANYRHNKYGFMVKHYQLSSNCMRISAYGFHSFINPISTQKTYKGLAGQKQRECLTINQLITNQILLTN